jgi:glycosyltransferase involved in cell wall biosynthesis
MLRVKVCLLTRFFSLRNGGIGRFSIEMRNRLQSRGQDLVPIETTRTGMAGLFWYSALEIRFKMPRNCDVYHCLTPVESLHVPKARSVSTFHDIIPLIHLEKIETHYAQTGLAGMISKGYFRLVANAAARCAAIACNSEQTRRDVIEHLDVDERKVSVIRFGIGPGLKPALKADKRFRVGTLSYLDRRKRIDLLIQGFLAANVDGELVIGGVGVDESRLRALAGDDPRIKFVGFVNDDQMPGFFNSLDYFVFPSKIEGYGLPIVEAMACKRPVVLLRDAIIPDELKARSIVVEDVAEFLRSPYSRADIESNHAFARSHDWDACVDGYLELYRRVAGA